MYELALYFGRCEYPISKHKVREASVWLQILRLESQRNKQRKARLLLLKLKVSGSSGRPQSREK